MERDSAKQAVEDAVKGMESALGRSRGTARDIVLTLFSADDVRRKDVAQVGTPSCFESRRFPCCGKYTGTRTASISPRTSHRVPCNVCAEIIGADSFFGAVGCIAAHDCPMWLSTTASIKGFVLICLLFIRQYTLASS